MQQIKEIIINRIKDILQLEHLYQKQEERKKIILKQKNMELQRNNKEIRLLVSLDSYMYDCESIFMHILPIVYEICVTYDKNIKVQEGEDARAKLYKLLKIFFINNDYREKLSQLKSAFTRLSYLASPRMIFTWLSQWSKKKYMQILHLEIKPSQEKASTLEIENQENGQQIRDSLNSNIRYSYKSQHYEDIRQSYKSYNTENVREQTRKQSYKMPTFHRKSQLTIEYTDQIVNRIDRFKTISHPQPNPNPRILTIYNKPTLYGYLYDELLEYYRLADVMDLDKNYIRALRKKKLKEYLMTYENQKKVIEVLIESSANKEIKNLIKEYENGYKIYREQQKRRSSFNNINKNTFKKLNESLSVAVRQKKVSLYLPIKGTRTVKNSRKATVDSIDQLHMNSIHTQFSENNEGIFQNVKEQPNVRMTYKVNKTDISSNSIKVRLPNIAKSIEKSEKVKTIKYPTQQNQYSGEEKDLEVVYNAPKLKFNQRQTIRGIIMKNFLSNRDKIGKNIQQQLQTDEKNELLYIKNAKKTKISCEKLHKMVDRSPQCAQIRQLRQKTNAILINFRTIQNY